jgi:predicted phage-related endonuclease
MVAVATPVQNRSDFGIGASGAAAAIDCSDYGSPVDAWLDVTGRAKFAGNKATEWGNRLEPVIRQTYCTKHGVTVHVPKESLFHVDLPFVRATPDGIVLDPHGAWSYVGPQCKNVGLRQAPLWADGALPNDYLIQGVTEMAVTNLDRIDFYVLIGGQDDREVTLWRDAELEAEVLEALTDFWGFVERDEQPPITGSKKLRAHLAGLVTKAAVIEATPADIAVLERWREIARQAKALEAEEKKIRNIVLAELVKRGGNKMSSPLGMIAVPNGTRKTRWKEVAGDLARMSSTLDGVDGELLAIAMTTADEQLRDRLTGLRTAIALNLGDVGGFAQSVTRHTNVNPAGPRRPNDWTKNLDEENDDE